VHIILFYLLIISFVGIKSIFVCFRLFENGGVHFGWLAAPGGAVQAVQLTRLREQLPLPTDQGPHVLGQDVRGQLGPAVNLQAAHRRHVRRHPFLPLRTLAVQTVVVKLRPGQDRENVPRSHLFLRRRAAAAAAIQQRTLRSPLPWKGQFHLFYP